MRPARKLLVLDGHGNISHAERFEFVSFLRRGDLVVANDAATIPASLFGRHEPTGRAIEVRLAGRDDVSRFSVVVFGEGDFRMRTEDRPAPPLMKATDQLELGPLRATVTRVLHHTRFLSIQFSGSADEIWEGLARHGRPIQYSHVPVPLALWDTWTAVAGPPVAFEPPSAGFALDWNMLAAMANRGAEFATITHAAGISSTGDPTLDALLPFDEPYRIPQATARAIAKAGRVIAIGTTVVRALEHAASHDGIVRAGEGMATQRISSTSRLRVVAAILSGTHERGTSHYELLRAFADDEALGRMDRELSARSYQPHEFGDSVYISRADVVKDISTPLMRQ